jgi:hypothetical protein
LSLYVIRKEGWRRGSEGRRCDPTVASTISPPRPPLSCRIHHLAVASTISAILDLAVASVSLSLLSLCRFYLSVTSIHVSLHVTLSPTSLSTSPVNSLSLSALSLSASHLAIAAWMISPVIFCSAKPILSTVISSQWRPHRADTA